MTIRARARRAPAAAAALALCVSAFGAHIRAASAGALPGGITSIMHKPLYARASWSLLVTDLRTGETVYQLNPDRLAFTGSVRKLFSVGTALNALGADHRFTTPVYRQGTVAGGVLRGNLVLVGAGDLTLGGRSDADRTIAFTDFDHNDANNLGTAILTPQDPLRGLDDLARQVRASGIRAVRGDVVVDDRLFQSYRVPNGNLLVSPIMVNENMVDVSLAPTRAGKPARLDWRPKTAAFAVRSHVETVAAGLPTEIELSNGGRIENCSLPCIGTLTGTIPVHYRAPFSGSATFVRTFRIEDPASFARIAFVQALARAGVTVSAPLLAKNPYGKLPSRNSYSRSSRVAAFVSPPFAQYAKLILKVSLNLGANLSLSLFGLAHGQRTIAGALAAERASLVGRAGIAPAEFDFPTNGSGSPDSRAAPRATVRMLAYMSRSRNAAPFRAALPILGVDGSLAGTGRALPARGHVFAKTGTTFTGEGLKAQVLAGYIDTKRGRHFAFALYVNDVGPLKSIADISRVFQDEAEITNVIYGSN